MILTYLTQGSDQSNPPQRTDIRPKSPKLEKRKLLPLPLPLTGFSTPDRENKCSKPPNRHTYTGADTLKQTSVEASEMAEIKQTDLHQNVNKRRMY